MYKASGKQVLYSFAEGGNQHIADATNEDNARYLADAMNGRSSTFIRDAMVTCSPLFHGDMVSEQELRHTMGDAIAALNALDKVKKSLFYGRDNNLISDGEHDTSSFPDKLGIDRAVATNVIHAILGIATEAGELLEALRDSYNKGNFDWVNAKEEAGDLAWYEALLADAGGYTFEEVQQRIILKLKTRYAEKFSAAEAITRNLDAERQVLEGNTGIAGGVSMQDEGDLLAVNEAPLVDESGAAIVDPEFINIEGDPTAANVPGLKPSVPASGKEGVEQAEAEANQAFANVGNVAPKVEPEIPTSDELAKSPAERLNPLPGEDTAQQNAKP